LTYFEKIAKLKLSHRKVTLYFHF